MNKTDDFPWKDEGNRADFEKNLTQHIATLKNLPALDMTFGPVRISNREYVKGLEELRSVLDRDKTNLEKIILSYFDVSKSTADQKEKG